MATQWGDLPLRITSYSRPGADLHITERPLLVAPGTQAPASVLMGTGRKRRRINVSGYGPLEDVLTLEQDRHGYQIRQFSAPDGLVWERALIERMDYDVRPGMADVGWYTITLVEM